MESYHVEFEVGHGHFGRALVCEHKILGKRVVIKRIPMRHGKPEERTKAMQEAMLLRGLQHPCIVRYVDYFLTPTNVLCIVMEYCDGGDVADLVKKARDARTPLSSDAILDLFSRVVLAVAYCHTPHGSSSVRVLHRDIKCSNIFLTSDGRVFLGDFGVSKILMDTHDMAATVIGERWGG